MTTGQAFAAAVVGGALAGGISAGSVEGALWGAFSGAVFFGIGQQFGGSLGDGQGVFGSTFKSGELVRASVAHGLAGGTISEMQGGKFGHGFLSAGISKAATPMAVGVSDQVYIQGAAIAIVGGTTSEISGGKFANGAVTSAMAFAFNQCASGGCSGSSDNSSGKVLSGGFKLLGEDFSSNENFVLVHDSRTKTAWYVPRAIAPEVVEAIASNRTDLAGASRSGAAQVGVNGFLGVAGISFSGGVVSDSSGNTCGFIASCFQVGLGLGAGGGGGLSASLSEIQPGVSRSSGPFGFGGTGIISSGSLDLTNGGANLDFIGPGVGAAGGYQFCIQNNFACN